jgi:hypothetical protein
MFDRALQILQKNQLWSSAKGGHRLSQDTSKNKFMLRKLFTCKKKLENSVCEERKLLDYGWFIFQTDDQ